MTFAAAMAVAAVTGGFTGALMAGPAGRSSTWVRAGAVIAGAVLAAITFVMLLALDSIVLFGDTPSIPAALGFTLMLEAIAAGAGLLASHLQQAFNRGSSQLPANIDELLDSYPAEDPRRMWVLGVAVPLVFVLFGARTVAAGDAEIGTTLFRKTVEGLPAIAYGIGWAAVGAFLHFHFFWGMRPRLQAHSRRGKVIALVCGCVALSYVASQSMG